MSFRLSTDGLSRESPDVLSPTSMFLLNLVALGRAVMPENLLLISNDYGFCVEWVLRSLLLSVRDVW